MKLEFDDYTKICDIVNAMPVAADGYVPPRRLIHDEIENGTAGMMLFGIWLDETGEKTKENEPDRRYLSEALRRNLDFIG